MRSEDCIIYISILSVSFRFANQRLINLVSFNLYDIHDNF